MSDMNRHQQIEFMAIYSSEEVSAFFILLFTCLIYLAVPSLSCVMWDLVPWSGIEPRPHALGA